MNALRPLVLALSGALLAAVAAADDLQPPAWRGTTGASLRVWDFATDSIVTGPSSSTVAGDTATATVNVEPLFGTGWYDTDAILGTQQGWWDVARGSIILDIPLETVPGTYAVHLQITYLEGLNTLPSVTMAGGSLDALDNLLVEDVPPLDAWRSSVQSWTVSALGPVLSFQVDGDAAFGSQIDFIAVDLVQIPEPGTVALLLAAGGLLIAASRRRRR